MGEIVRKMQTQASEGTASPKVLSRVPVQRPVTGRFATKSLSSIFWSRDFSKSGLEAVANDKDGGYSFVDPEVLTDIHLQLLANGQYSETDLTDGDRRCAKASMSYSTLCKRVKDLEQKPELARELRESLSVPGAAIEAQLVTSCKSHKPPDAVKCRNIHSWSRNVVCKTTQRTIEAVSDFVP